MIHSATPSAQRRRRPLLLALLLACLIALVYARPDLREPAVAAAGRAVHAVLGAAGISPRAVYTLRLRVAGLYDTPLGRRWRTAPDSASGIPLGSRRSSTLDFQADRIDARIYTTALARGMALRWRLARASSAAGRLFADLQRSSGDGASQRWTTVATLAADGQTQQYTSAESGRYRLVFQPELGAAVRAKLAIVRGGSLPFPVVGGHGYDIGGGFGAARDGGARKHQGVDIFADRGTPVRAVADGRVSTGNGGLGGHYIFLSSGLAGTRYYYAHLDRFAVENGVHVKKGHVIGCVGNSGNAAGGPTHLHFGIYTSSGAIDPAPFIRPMPDLPGP